MLETAGYFLALLTGLLMGLIGAGGGILSTTILVYLFGVSPALSASYTLLNVSIISLVGSVGYYSKKRVDFKIGLFFAIPSLILVICMRKWIMPAIPEHIFQFQHLVFTKNLLILLVFAALMIAISCNMVFGSTPAERGPAYEVSPGKLFLLGCAVAVLTGFAGIGGGFIIVPALVYFAKLNIKMAVGTSLFIIFVNTTVGFISDFSSGLVFDWGFVLKFIGITLAGMLISSRFSKSVNSVQLKKIFGISIFIIGCWIIIKEIFFGKVR
jgi:uncharacterized protein